MEIYTFQHFQIITNHEAKQIAFICKWFKISINLQDGRARGYMVGFLISVWGGLYATLNIWPITIDIYVGKEHWYPVTK